MSAEHIEKALEHWQLHRIQLAQANEAHDAMLAEAEAQRALAERPNEPTLDQFGYKPTTDTEGKTNGS